MQNILEILLEISPKSKGRVLQMMDVDGIFEEQIPCSGKMLGLYGYPKS